MYKTPYLSSWHTGTTTPAFGPEYQLQLLKEGAPIIPWMILPSNTKFNINYYRELLKEASAKRLPICFVGSQFERGLSEDKYFKRTENNPNCQKLDGTYERRVSPFGQLDDWYSCGVDAARGLDELFDLYRDPPYVLFVSNNEHPKLRWRDAQNYKDYVDRFGNTNPNTTREIISRCYTDRYNALLNGMRNYVKSNNFSGNWHCQFIGYNSFAPQFLGRYADWEKYSYHTVDNLNPWLGSWDGASCNYYTDANGATDYQLWSTQVEFMNLVEERKDCEHFELSIWNGGPNQIKKYTDAGQSYNPDRFEGWAQYGIWLMRPDTIRAFYPHTDQREPNEPYFRRLIDIVNRIQSNETLSAFWRSGELVKFGEHPYVYGKPVGWNAYKYMELPDYKHPRDLSKQINAFYLVLKGGLNSCLVYTHSPLGDTIVTIPITDEYGTKKYSVKSTPRGNFYYLEDNLFNMEEISVST